MSNLTLGDLKAGLKDLLGPRLVHFQPTAAHAMYGPMLSARLAEIEALPSALTGNKPNAVALAETDDRHDGYGASLWHLGQAILKHPDSTPELRASAERVLEGFIPRLGVLRAKYIDESQAAAANRARLTTLQADLEAIPSPLGGDALAIATAFVDSGDQLGQLLSNRAIVEANATGSLGGGVRSATIGLLGHVRSALEYEVAHNPARPRNLVNLVFGYFDLLSEFRQKHPVAEEAPPPPPPPETEPTSPTTESA